MQFIQSDGYDRARSNTYKFLGLDRGHYTYKGEFEDMYNMSTDEYPCAAPRSPREAVCNLPANVQAVAAPDVSNVSGITGFTGIANEGFYYNGVKKSRNTVLSSGFEWTIVRFRHFYIMNGYDAEHHSSVLYSYNIYDDSFERGGSMLDNLIVSVGHNSRGNYICAYRYAYTPVYNHVVSDSSGNTIIRNSDYFINYFKTSNCAPSSNFFEQLFSIGDEISISGFPALGERPGQVWSYNASSDNFIVQTAGAYDDYNTLDIGSVPDPGAVSLDQVCKATVTGFDTSSYSIRGVVTYIHYIYLDLRNKEDTHLQFSNMEGAGLTHYCSGISLSSVVQNFDNIFVHANRLWGSDPIGTRLYGSVAESPFDFHSTGVNGEFLFASLSSTSYGPFTGLSEYGLDLIAFKDDYTIIVSGDNPDSYVQTVIHGIGCIDKRSIQITPRGVIFLAYNGFYLYNGSQYPTRISNKLYDTRYVSAVSGFDGDKYYASAEREDGETELLVYDTRYSLWTIEDSTAHNDILADSAVVALGMFRFRGGFYIADYTSSKLLKYDSSASEVFRWSATSVKTHNNTLDNKALTELWFRAECIDGGSFSVSVSVDGGEFKVLSAHSSPRMTVYRIPVRIENGSSFRYRIFGKGKVIIYEVELHTPSGGRQYKDYERDISGDTDHDIIPEKNNEGKNYLI